MANKLLVGATYAGVWCALSILVWSVISLAIAGELVLGAFLFDLLVLLPSLIAVVAVLIGVLAGAVGAVRRSLVQPGLKLMALGHLVALVIPPIFLSTLVLTGTGTGWELIVIFPALVIGQLVAAVGLLRYRQARSEPAA